MLLCPFYTWGIQGIVIYTSPSCGAQSGKIFLCTLTLQLSVLSWVRQKAVPSYIGHSGHIAFLCSVFHRNMPLWADFTFRVSGPMSLILQTLRITLYKYLSNQWGWESFLNLIGMSSGQRMTRNFLWIDMWNMITWYCRVSLTDMLLTHSCFISSLFPFHLSSQENLAGFGPYPSSCLSDFLFVKVQFSTFYSKYIMMAH